MRLRSELLLALTLAALTAGCTDFSPAIDPLVICHNTNCSGTKLYGDDTLEALEESLGLVTDGKPSFDGMEADTYLYFDGKTSVCLFAHDTKHLETAATPRMAADLIAKHLQKDVAAFNGERFYLKLEVKPTVYGTDQFHNAQQLAQHAQCALDMARASTEGSRHPVTLIFDSMSECLLNELQYQLALPEWQPLATNPDLEILFSAQVVPSRACVPAHVDIRSINVHSRRDSSIDAIRPFMVWLDSHSENTETMKIVRHMNPEYISTSEVPFVRGYIEGYR